MNQLRRKCPIKIVPELTFRNKLTVVRHCKQQLIYFSAVAIENCICIPACKKARELLPDHSIHIQIDNMCYWFPELEKSIWDKRLYIPGDLRWPLNEAGRQYRLECLNKLLIQLKKD